MTGSMDAFKLYSLACVFLPCLVYQLFFIIKSRRCGKKVSAAYLVWLNIFLFYLWMVFDVTGVGTMGDILRYLKMNESPIIGGYNFVPFNSFGIGFFLNVVMCMPLGFLLPLIWKECRKCRKTVVTGAVFSLLIELTQIFNFRASDVDDLMTNTFGTLTGYLIWRVFAKISGDRLNSASDGKYGAAGYIILALAGVFFLYHPFIILRRMV